MTNKTSNFNKEQLIKRIEKQIDINAMIIERLSKDSLAVSRLAVETATMDMKILDIAMCELQERRKADSAEPIYQNYPDDGWCDCSKEIYEKLTELGCRTRIVYAAPPVPEECPAELLAFCEQVIDSRITANAKADELWNACAVAELQERRKADEVNKS
ncbi:hypothetical protein ACEF96_003155 [Salmonella enterica]|nr:hypothetical protein [Salmonella enterica]